MIKRASIIGLIFVCFLIFSMLSVCAADEEKSFTDPEGDALDLNGEDTNSNPNVDITDISYVKDGKEVTLTLTVKGNIVNRGDLNDSTSEDYVYYIISLSTTEHEYYIIYINQECELLIDLGAIGSVDFDYSGSTITFAFELNASSETYMGLGAETEDSSSSGDYIDDFYDIPGELEVTIDAPSTGKVGQSIDFSATVTGGTSYEYEWYFDEDIEPYSTSQSLTYTFDEAGTYNVTLFVSDQDDNQGYDSLTITISEDENNNGGDNNGNNQEDSNPAILLFAAVIAIIVIVGVIVVVIIIRR